MQINYNFEAEKNYIGSVLIRPEILIEYPIETDDLGDHVNRKIHRALVDGHTDPLVVANNSGVNFADVVERMSGVVSVLNAEQYQNEVLRAAQNRRVIGLAQDMVNEIKRDGNTDVVKYADRLLKTVHIQSDVEPMANVATDYLDYVAERDKNPVDVWGIPAPWESYNKVTGGIHFGQSVLIYGKPGIGKTITALQMGLYAAQQGYSVMFYELEMSLRDLFARLVSMVSRVPTDKVHRGQLTKEEHERVALAVEDIYKLKIKMSDKTHWTSGQIRANEKRNRSDLVIVDYLALLQDRADNSFERVEGAAKSLRQMAKDNQQALITISSEVKDGTIKGTKEVEFAQDTVWNFRAPNETDPNDPVRALYPVKLRSTVGFYQIDLAFERWNKGGRFEGLPLLKEYTQNLRGVK